MCYSQFLLTKLLTLTAERAVLVAKLVILGILSLTSFILALMAVVVAKLVILGISPLTSSILELRVVLVPKFVKSGILSSICLILELYSVFLTKSLLLHYLVGLNKLEQFIIFQYLIYLL